jgi:formylglycine-generating enzyme required for sulfatase activity
MPNPSQYIKLLLLLLLLLVGGACSSLEEAPLAATPGAQTLVPPTVTAISPTATSLPPTATPLPATETPIPSTAVPPTATAEPRPNVTVPEMVKVESGSFEMGSEEGHWFEGPVHTVRITRPFYISETEVTWALYDQFVAATGRSKATSNKEWGVVWEPDYPAAVSWDDAIAFANWLSRREGLTPVYSGKGRVTRANFAADGYRLPTEAEWEYAARGGPLSQGTLYAGGDDAEAVAWYGDNSGGTTHPVGLKGANELGLYDMSGNAWEWCWDWFDVDAYSASVAEDPAGPDSGTDRVRRSGAWAESSDTLRVTYRSADLPSMPFGGIRLVRTVAD